MFMVSTETARMQFNIAGSKKSAIVKRVLCFSCAVSQVKVFFLVLRAAF